MGVSRSARHGGLVVSSGEDSDEDLCSETFRDDEGPGVCGCWGGSVDPASMCLSTLVILLALVATFYGVQAAPLLLSMPSSVTYSVPEGSPSQIAYKRLADNFPFLARVSDSQVVMVIRTTSGTSSVLTDAVDDYTVGVARNATKDWRTELLDPAIIGYYVGNSQLGLKPKDPILKAGYVSPDETMTLMEFVAKKEPPVAEHLEHWQVRENVISFLKECGEHAPAGTEVMLTGNPITSHDASFDRSIEALLRAEVCVVPFALLVIVCLVRQLRLLVLPPVVLVVTFLTACVFVVPVTWVMPFSTDIPPAMVSVTIALSLDYSLFFLTRFNENVLLSMPVKENVEVMLHNTAHTIGVSGLLIAIAFFAAVTIPEANLQSAGMCMGLTTIASLLVNSTLTPALLLVFGRQLTRPLCRRNAGPRSRRVSRVLQEAQREAAVAAAVVNGHSDSTDQMFLSSRSSKTQLRLDGGASGWLWLMRCIEQCPMLTVVLLFAAFSPLLMQLRKLHATADAYAILPASLPSIEATRQIEYEGFPYGRFEPYTVVVDWRWPQRAEDWNAMDMPSGKKSAMLCPYAFKSMLDLCDLLRGTGNISTMLGPVWLMDKRVDWEYAHDVMKAMVNKDMVQMRRLYTAVLATHVTAQKAVLQLHTQFPPRASGAADWVLAVRDYIRAWEAKHPEFHATLSGGATAEADIRAVVIGAMPVYVGTTVVGVMVMVLIMFRSLLLPLRLAFALLFTLAATYSIAVVIYQTTLLHSYFPWLKLYYGITYESIPLATCIAVALGLDYDIFLITRIVEYRLEGFTDRDSIVLGVTKTGGIISGAGLIMALAFTGLLFSSKLQLHQFASLMIASVLLDTFIVRTVLVPALMLSAGSWNWWPRAMPEPIFGDTDESADSDTSGQRT